MILSDQRPPLPDYWRDVYAAANPPEVPGAWVRAALERRYIIPADLRDPDQ